MDFIAHPLPAQGSFGLSRNIDLKRADPLGLQQIFGMIAQKGAVRDPRPQRRILARGIACHAKAQRLGAHRNVHMAARIPRRLRHHDLCAPC